MIGSAIILRPHKPIEFRTYTGLLDPNHFSDTLDGLLELVPHFDQWLDAEGKLRECTVFADQEAELKGLEINHYASAIWNYIADLKGIDYRLRRRRMLTGPVAIVFGDEEFMEAL